MQGCLLVVGSKVLVVDLYAVQRAVPARNQKTTTRNKRNQANKKHTTTTKPKQTKTQRSGIATSNGNNMHDDILCVIMRMAARLHELQLSAYNCTFCYIGSSFWLELLHGCADSLGNSKPRILVDYACKDFCLLQ